MPYHPETGEHQHPGLGSVTTCFISSHCVPAGFSFVFLGVVQPRFTALRGKASTEQRGIPLALRWAVHRQRQAGRRRQYRNTAANKALRPLGIGDWQAVDPTDIFVRTKDPPNPLQHLFLLEIQPRSSFRAISCRTHVKRESNS
jgi:hypothetical protein